MTFLDRVLYFLVALACAALLGLSGLMVARAAPESVWSAVDATYLPMLGGYKNVQGCVASAPPRSRVRICGPAARVLVAGVTAAKRRVSAGLETPSPACARRYKAMVLRGYEEVRLVGVDYRSPAAIAAHALAADTMFRSAGRIRACLR